MGLKGPMRGPYEAHRYETLKTFFFWRSPEFGQKKRFNFGEDLFFWRSPEFGQQSRFNFGEDPFFLEIT